MLGRERLKYPALGHCAAPARGNGRRQLPSKRRQVGDLAIHLCQVLRILLAPLGSLTGRIPAGNTGRANVSVFKTMPIPADLAAALSEEPQ